MCLVKERLNPGPGQKQPLAKRLPSVDHTEVRSGPHKPGPRRTASERYPFYLSVWLARSVLLSRLPPHPLLFPLFDQSDSTTMCWRFIVTQRLRWEPLPDGVDCASHFSLSSNPPPPTLAFLPLSLHCTSMSNSEFLMSFCIPVLVRNLSRLLGREHYTRTYLRKADVILCFILPINAWPMIRIHF